MTDDLGIPKGRPPGQRDRYPAAGVAHAAIGLQFALVLLVFFFGGRWLDRKLGTDPWLMMIGIFVGAAGGIYSMYRKAMAMQDREDRAKRGDPR